MFANIRIGFVGGGNMGEALIRGFLAASLFSSNQISVFDVISERLEYLRQQFGIQTALSSTALVENCEVVILAVKPQTMARVLDTIHGHLNHKPLVVSIAAGIPLSFLEATLPAKTPIIRVMPNTPALVQQAASALARGACASDADMHMAIALFEAVGKAVEVEEKSMDAVTGLSGSGPAYLLLLLESLIDAGVLMGLPRTTARELVVQTALGTATMLAQGDKHPGELKDQITSPGGTTIHGLRILEERGVRGALMAAVQTATQRSLELGSK
ncbi:MAG TPA: pyrroline-5-carboxylate reductase [Syntrophobacteraceae bacterium]|nr:pyrroline-5-carboxylate reductase [Syntrophobacteraceae bacterium]